MVVLLTNPFEQINYVEDVIEVTTAILIILATIVIGTFSIIGGLGGGVLASSILILFFNIPVKTVTSSVLISISVPAIIGTIGAWKRGEIDIKLAFMMEISVASGAVTGAMFSVYVPSYVINLLFTLLTLILGIIMIRRGYNGDSEPNKFWKSVGKIPPVIKMGSRNSEYHISLSVLTFLGFIIGFTSSLLGIGGGWMNTPLLIGGFGVPAVIATGTVMPMLVVTSLVGGMTYIAGGLVDFSLSIAVAIGLGIGAIFGNILKPKLGSSQITIILGIILILTSFLFTIRIIG